MKTSSTDGSLQDSSISSLTTPIITRVAVYGTLRKGGKFHRALSRAKYLGDQYLPFPLYLDWHGYPSVSLQEEGRVLVEVYKIDSQTLEWLDKIECYPRLYTRSLVSTQWGEAWIYETAEKKPDLRDLIPTGDFWQGVE